MVPPAGMPPVSAPGRPPAGGPPDGPSSLQERPASLWPSSLLGRAGFASTVQSAAEAGSRPGPRPEAVFDVCHPALALRAVLWVQLALAVWAVAGAGHAAQVLARLASGAFGGVMATLAWLALVCLLRRPLAAASPALRAATLLAGGALAGLVAWAPQAALWLAPADAWSGLGAMLAGLALSAVLMGWLELRARVWQPVDAQVRLAELQSRIRPHFLFNALNSAIALVRVDPQRAEAVLEDLAELFRAALAETGTSVSLAEEIELARRYLEIEQVRFGARLQLRWKVDPRSLVARVPPLVLQPLVENAVRHGVEPRPEGGVVTVEATIHLGQVQVTVTNPLPDGASATPGQGMALDNVRERLRLLHDLGAQCDTWVDAGAGPEAVYCARLTVPGP